MKLSDKIINWGVGHPFCWFVLIPGILILCWILLVMLGGCATINRIDGYMSTGNNWHKEGGTKSQTYRDIGDCAKKVERPIDFDQCMQEKNYTWRETL